MAENPNQPNPQIGERYDLGFVVAVAVAVAAEVSEYLRLGSSISHKSHLLLVLLLSP